jgi:hypothetical protein
MNSKLTITVTIDLGHLSVNVQINVWGELVFSVMAAGWLCEKSG